MALTPKQENFCREYLIDLNATQAAIRAGYSQKTASAIAQENLRKPMIMERIQKARQKSIDKLEVTRERILAEYAKIAFSDITDFLKVEEIEGRNQQTGEYVGIPVVTVFPTDGMPKQRTAALSEIRQTKEGISVKMHDKKGALDSLARHLGMFNDKLELSGKVQTDVKHDLKKLDRQELLQLEHILEKSAESGTGSTG